MNKCELKEQAVKILYCNLECIEEIEIPEINAMYFRDRNRGGGALIISDNGEMLFVDPFFVDFDEHKNRFASGERTHFEE